MWDFRASAGQSATIISYRSAKSLRCRFWNAYKSECQYQLQHWPISVIRYNYRVWEWCSVVDFFTVRIPNNLKPIVTPKAQVLEKDISCKSKISYHFKNSMSHFRLDWAHTCAILWCIITIFIRLHYIWLLILIKYQALTDFRKLSLYYATCSIQITICHADIQWKPYCKYLHGYLWYFESFPVWLKEYIFSVAVV